MKYIAIDTETTGRDAQTCDIVEIGAVVLNEDGEELARFHRFVEFDAQKMEPEALDLHGIDAPPETAVPVHVAVEDLRQFALDWDARTIIGHNFPQYDMIALQRHITKGKWDEAFDYRICDTSVLASANGLKGLKGACLHLGLPTPPHRALEDALLEAQVWFGLRPPQDDLYKVLMRAHAQAVSGKGSERHGGWDDGPWRTIARECGPGFLTGQVVKKAMECRRLDSYARERELLGSIVYAAMAILEG